MSSNIRDLGISAGPLTMAKSTLRDQNAVFSAAAPTSSVETPVTSPEFAKPIAPTTWDRLRGWFGREREAAKSVYLRLLRKSEIDGRELSDKEIDQLGRAMKEAGITEVQADEHRTLIRDYTKAAKAKADVPMVETQIAALTDQIDALDRQFQEINRKAAPLHTERQELRNSHSSLQFAASPLDDLTARMKELFGE